MFNNFHLWLEKKFSYYIPKKYKVVPHYWAIRREASALFFEKQNIS